MGRLIALGRPGGPFPPWLLGLSLLHHALAYTCLHRLYMLSVPGSRYVRWYPLAGLVLDVILFRAFRSCLTGRVTWRGTEYRGASDTSASAQAP